MAEKLYKTNCHVQGHGCRCCVSREKIPDKKRLSKLRRKKSKKIIQEERE
jgi:hypothetical protein